MKSIKELKCFPSACEASLDHKSKNGCAIQFKTLEADLRGDLECLNATAGSIQLGNTGFEWNDSDERKWYGSAYKTLLKEYIKFKLGDKE